MMMIVVVRMIVHESEGGRCVEHAEDGDASLVTTLGSSTHHRDRMILHE